MLRRFEHFSSARLTLSTQRVITQPSFLHSRRLHPFPFQQSTSFRSFSIMSGQRINDLIDGIIRDIDNSPSFRSFSTSQAQSPSHPPPSNVPKGRKKTKKKIKVKKQKVPKNKPAVKASKRSQKLATKSTLPPPTLINGIKCLVLPLIPSAHILAQQQ